SHVEHHRDVPATRPAKRAVEPHDSRTTRHGIRAVLHLLHSPFIFAALMMGHHFSISALWSAPSASGVCCSRGKISCPISASRARTVGSANASTAAALSLPMMSIGVRLGAQSAYHTDA